MRASTVTRLIPITDSVDPRVDHDPFVKDTIEDVDEAGRVVCRWSINIAVKTGDYLMC